jgi:DNA helicase HerA-like ATPase
MPAESGVEFGGLVRLDNPSATVFGVVTALWIEGAGVADAGTRMIRIELLGEIAAAHDGAAAPFRRGVSCYPGLDAAVRLAQPADLARIYARPQVAAVRIGHVRQTNDLPAFVAVDALLGKHFAVLGTTGTGKSCAVALLLQSVLAAHPNGHVIILDPHGEYAPAFGEAALCIGMDELRLPYWLMNADELVSTLVRNDGSERETEANILKQAVAEARRIFAGADAELGAISVNTPLPFRLGDLDRILANAMGRLNRGEGALPYLRLRERLDALGDDPRFRFLFDGLMVRDTMTDVLARLLRVPVEGRPATILDLSGVPAEVMDAVVSLICRMLFDFAVWSVEPQALPLLIVCEEAHRYVPEDQTQGFALSRAAVARIAKEGRKYGVSLCLVSQRPSELSATILSQCNTIIALRLLNERDQAFVASAMPEGTSGLLASLPALHNREAIVVGEGVPLPMIVCLDELAAGARPRSTTASFAAAWEYDALDRQFVADTVERWRRQARCDEIG